MASTLIPLKLYFIEVEGGIYYESEADAKDALAFYSKEFPAKDYGELSYEEIDVNRKFFKYLTNFKEARK